MGVIPLSNVNRFINIFVPGGNYHEIKEIGNFAIRDIPNVIERFQAHISFTKEEEVKGKIISITAGKFTEIFIFK